MPYNRRCNAARATEQSYVQAIKDLNFVTTPHFGKERKALLLVRLTKKKRLKLLDDLKEDPLDK